MSCVYNVSGSNSSLLLPLQLLPIPDFPQTPCALLKSTDSSSTANMCTGPCIWAAYQGVTSLKQTHSLVSHQLSIALLLRVVL